jgi:hypothetical protein
VRIVNLSLFTGDWYIRQMQRKMNQSEPLPITMPYDKYKEGVRDVIYYNDAKIPGYIDVKDVFDFISSDDKRTMVQYQNGDYANYLPTKNIKIDVNPNDVIKYGVVPAGQEKNLTDTIRFKYTSNYVMKDNLAMMDILAHNNWKRPICFTVTVGGENMIGLQPYLYKEGFVYHLMPLKPDTTVKDQLEKVNTMVMYNNVMNKFKFGNFKTARYLDHESTTMFYPVMISTFLDLAQNLIKQGHPDLALKVMHKYDDVMPDLNIDIRIADSKFFLAQTAYQLHDLVLGSKLATSIDNYLTDQLDYDYYMLQSNSGTLNPRDIAFSTQLINAMADLAKDNHQTALASKLQAQAKDYESKFASVIGGMR